MKKLYLIVLFPNGSSAFFHIQRPTFPFVIFFKTMDILMTIKLVKFLKIMAEILEKLH